MSKVRNLTELTSLDDTDLIYAVDVSEAGTGDRKVQVSTLRTEFTPTASEVKALYESNSDTNAFTDAEKTKLAGVETGATADQIASEVPYSNASTGLTATDVQSAMDEIYDTVDHFRVSVVTGLVVSYTAGLARFGQTTYNVAAGNILLATNITDGVIYVDVDGTVKQTASSTNPPDFSIPIGIFTTDVSSVISLVSHRQKIDNIISAGVTGDISTTLAGTAVSAGTTNRFADAGHRHAISTGTAVTLDASSTNTEGGGTTLARAAHTHAITTTGTPSSTGTANAGGSSASLARIDHVHKTVIAYTVVSATLDDTTVSTTPVLIAGMTITPAAGTYSVRFSGSTVNSGNGSERNYFQIYSGGSAVSGSFRKIGVGGGSYSSIQTQAVVTVNGSQAIEARWYVIAGTGTIGERNMIVEQLA